MTYQVLTFNWGSGYNANIAGRPRSIVVCDWNERDMQLSYEQLKGVKPAFAEFYIGNHQHLYDEKMRFALALCKSLNERIEAINSLEVKV